MKKYLLFATAALAFASCTNESYLGTAEELATTKGEQPISFGSGLNAITRADKTGAAAATDLNGKFYVWGIKKESSDGAGAVGVGNLVYNNYVVEWTDNSAMTTTSNTKGWEYVGKTLSAAEQACITPNGAANVQTIKYWDWGAPDYTFYAFTADPVDLDETAANAKITVVKKTTETSSVYDNGYTVNIKAGANLDKLYFAERVNITKSSNTERIVPNQYGGNVTFRFHNTATKVRVAMYETIPGYSVTINKFSVDNDGANPEFAAMTDDVTANFAANLQYSPKGVAGTMTVTYDPNVGTATHNWPVVDFTPTAGKTKVLALGTGLAANVVLGTSITGATYDKVDDPATTGVNESYTSVYPNETNTQNMKVKLSYTLTAPVTGETIVVTNATAEIPAAYLKWKPGFAYTYIFKISDNTNGSSGTPGTDPAGLYPITFDAVEMLADDGSAEYSNEYTLPTGTDKLDIYATFMEGSEVKTPTVNGSGAQYVNVFAVTTTDATNFPITEASVAEAIAANKSNAMNVDIYTYDDGTSTYTKVTDATTLNASVTYYKADGTSKAPGETGYTSTVAVADVDYVIVKIKATNISTATTPYFTAAPAKVPTVPGEDGVNKTIDALKLTGVKAGTYAIEYEASAAWTGSYKKVYKVIVVQ